MQEENATMPKQRRSVLLTVSITNQLNKRREKVVFMKVVIPSIHTPAYSSRTDLWGRTYPQRKLNSRSVDIV